MISKITPAVKNQMKNSMKIFKRNNPDVSETVHFDRKLGKIRQQAIDLYERNLEGLNIFDTTESNRPIYDEAIDTLRNFVNENIPKIEDRKAVYQSILAEVNPKKHAEIEAFSGKLEILPTPSVAKNVMELDTQLDALEGKLQRIKNEAIQNGQTELNRKQLTRYNKVIREYNKVREQHAFAVRVFQRMKGANQTIFEEFGMGDFYKKYSSFPYSMSQKISTPAGIPQSVKSVNGSTKYIYEAIPRSGIYPSGKQMVELKDVPKAKLILNTLTDKISHVISSDQYGKREIKFYNEDGDLFKITTSDPRSKKVKVKNIKTK
jgi:hypothetical protein